MMMFTTRLIIIHALLLFSLLSAQEYTAAQIMEHVQKKYSAMHDASASFEQRTMLRFGKKEQIQSGTLKIKKGNKYCVETTDQQLIADGKTVWIVSKANNQVLIDAFKENNKIFSPDKFLQGLPDVFPPVGVSKENDLFKITLEPKKANTQTRQIRELSAWVRSDSWIVEKIMYKDRNQNQIEIKIGDVQFNAQLNDSVFHFTPPQGMKVVDLRNLR